MCVPGRVLTVTTIRSLLRSRLTLGGCVPSTALVLTDFTGSRFNSEMVELARKLAADNKPHIRASALVGLSGLQIVLFTGINRKADRDMQWFNALDTAKEWLVAQAEAQEA